ncbi:hypothetical protein RRG08_065824 [Elysia crispata]|uniref:Uncharacterized protein n=1 Tax=Elysia crispata TaxID=231223 RepID=A0AAE1B001_9GAST|nr:hypothetical protein RRG08_065824 [Elysia crispata]
MPSVDVSRTANLINEKTITAMSRVDNIRRYIRKLSSPNSGHSSSTGPKPGLASTSEITLMGYVHSSASWFRNFTVSCFAEGKCETFTSMSPTWY